ncbi:MAG: hypothetical protein LBS94_05645 [Prevotellaceae bacterium]|nr:hypothetical protein [Prevotellaceae bacterium]
MKTFLVFALVLGVCVVLLGVKIFFSRTKKFPQTEIACNAEMRKRGITCPIHDERRKACGECDSKFQNLRI